MSDNKKSFKTTFSAKLNVDRKRVNLLLGKTKRWSKTSQLTSWSKWSGVTGLGAGEAGAPRKSSLAESSGNGK